MKSTLACKDSLTHCSVCSAEREGGDLEISTGIHNVSFLSVFVLSFAPEGPCFTWTRQQRHATLDLRSLPRCLLALSPSKSANDRCCRHSSNPAALRENPAASPKPKVAGQDYIFGWADMFSQLGVRWSLLSLTFSL